MPLMPTRNVSLIGRGGSSVIPFAPSISFKFRNYAVVVWSPTESLMLHLELHESWSDQNFLWFKRVPREPLAELVRRKAGRTNWPDESIIAQGMQIITRGPPYISKRWHVFWPDHQSFAEELSNAIIESPRPKVTPPALLVYKGPDALKNWNPKGPPMAVTFQNGDNAVSDEWTGGKGMLCAYPGGPARIRKP